MRTFSPAEPATVAPSSASGFLCFYNASVLDERKYVRDATTYFW